MLVTSAVSDSTFDIHDSKSQSRYTGTRRDLDQTIDYHHEYAYPNFKGDWGAYNTIWSDPDEANKILQDLSIDCDIDCMKRGS